MMTSSISDAEYKLRLDGEGKKYFATGFYLVEKWGRSVKNPSRESPPYYSRLGPNGENLFVVASLLCRCGHDFSEQAVAFIIRASGKVQFDCRSGSTVAAKTQCPETINPQWRTTGGIEQFAFKFT